MKEPKSTDNAEEVQLPHLETFAKAAELGSFTGAAQALGLTQAAVSGRIRGLEHELGVSLFDRHGGRVHLSDAGRRLFEYARRILDLHRQAREEITGQPAPLCGDLRLAASSIPGQFLLPGILVAFQQRYPNIQVRANVTDSLAVSNSVERGKAALGLVGQKTDVPHLEFRPFAADRLVLVVPKMHCWSKLDEVSAEQLCQQPLIVREAGSGSRWCLEQALWTVGKSTSDLRIVLELGNNEAIKEALLRGMGVAVLSSYAVQKELQAGSLHALSVSDLDLQREMFVIWDRRRGLSSQARVFLHFLESHHPDAEGRP